MAHPLDSTGCQKGPRVLSTLPASLLSGVGMHGLREQFSPQRRPASLCLCFPALTPDVVHQSLFMSALSAHPDRSLSVCWEQHCKLLPGVAGISASTVAKWTIDEVRSEGPSLSLSSPPPPSHHTLVERPRSGRTWYHSWHYLVLICRLPSETLPNRPIVAEGAGAVLLFQPEIQQERQTSVPGLRSKGPNSAHLPA